LHGRVEIDVEALVLDELYSEGVALVAAVGLLGGDVRDSEVVGVAVVRVESLRLD
jgi:hypothetical protein